MSLSILFMEKVLMRPCRGTPGGVEVFNLNLLRDLAALGHGVTVIAHKTWEVVIRQWPQAGPVEIVPMAAGGDLLGCLASAFRLRRRRFSVLLLGNVGDRLTPALALLRRARVAERCVLIAHREPTPRFVGAVARSGATVLAVNAKIAGHFRVPPFARVEVGYGVTEADRFYPRTTPRAAEAPIQFCVVGDLDRPWKGADTAVAAFRLLPESLRPRCRLHLAAFANPPADLGPEIQAHAWIPFREMGDFLRQMDVMVVPSRDEDVMRETFCQTAVQGMLAGLPLIVSDLPVLTEKIDRGGGLVARDVAQLVEAMVTLATDDALRARLGGEARRTALGRYVWNTSAFVDRFLLEPGAGWLSVLRDGASSVA
jgi:glycosyltransferase involved in cell wall biosynthesis